MNNEQLNENLKNLLDGFMAQKDLEGEIKFFDESGLTVDEQCVKELHEKKMELLRVMEEAKKDKKKLSEADMADISGGSVELPLKVQMAIAGIAASFVNSFYKDASLGDAMSAGVNSVLFTVVANLVTTYGPALGIAAGNKIATYGSAVGGYLLSKIFGQPSPEN